jgi:hypothetical protein
VLSHVAGMSGKLMLMHGMMDENVHFRHTARLVRGSRVIVCLRLSCFSNATLSTDRSTRSRRTERCTSLSSFRTSGTRHET